jgi:hypothetical protein
MDKKATVKMLLELIQQINRKSIPTTADGSMDMEKFYKLPEVEAVITLLKVLKVDNDYLCNKGFVPASLVFGSALRK